MEIVFRNISIILTIMGATTSMSGVSVDELKNSIFGAVVFMLSPKLDKELSFKPEDKLSDEDTHVLPEALSSNLTEAIHSFYKGESTVRDQAIEKYVNEHILDSDAHMREFIQLLLNKLKSHSHSAPSAQAQLSSHRSSRHTRALPPRPPAQRAPIEQQIDHRLAGLGYAIKQAKDVPHQEHTPLPVDHEAETVEGDYEQESYDHEEVESGHDEPETETMSRHE